MDHVVLEISSFRGYGGIHYYGKLLFYDQWKRFQSVELEQIMSEEYAAELSLLDNWHYTPGRATSRFDSKEEIRKVAISKIQEVAPENDILIEGSFACAEPQRCLWVRGDIENSVKEKLNEIWVRCDNTPHIPKNDAKIDKYIVEWETIISEYLKELKK